MKVETHSTLSLSTSHLKQETLNMLDEYGFVLKHYGDNFGGLLIIQEEEHRVPMPKDLIKCIEIADKVNCDLILFHPDVPPVKGLKVYNWG